MRASLFRLLFAIGGAVGIATQTLIGADALVPDLKKLADDVDATALKNEAIRWDSDVKGRPALYANQVIWLKAVNFTEGIIECDILGKSAPRSSNFPGIAFHGLNDTTFDCVYFRPFNFRADNPVNAAHAVQYDSVPDWPWPKLRQEKAGQYEKPITPRLDGDDWFHAKIVIAGRKVSVFVNDAIEPCLAVQLLNERTGGRIGISGGDGHFANLKIIPRAP